MKHTECSVGRSGYGSAGGRMDGWCDLHNYHHQCRAARLSLFSNDSQIDGDTQTVIQEDGQIRGRKRIPVGWAARQRQAVRFPADESIDWGAILLRGYKCYGWDYHA